LLTGEHLFQGADSTEIMARAVTQEPHLDKAPVRVRRLLRDCLKKDPAERLAWIGDAEKLLEPDVVDPSPRAPVNKPQAKWLVWTLAAALAAISAIAVWGWLRRIPRPANPVMRVTTPLALRKSPGAVAISPDGSELAFVSGPPPGLIYLRTMDQVDARSLAGTEGASFLSFSPDGGEISFVDLRSSPQILKKVATTGGSVQTLTTISAQRSAPAQNWGPDGNILFCDDGVLMRIPSRGGQPMVVARPEVDKFEIFFYNGQLLPGGREILLSVFAGPGRIVALNLQTGVKKQLLVTPVPVIAQFVAQDPAAKAGYLVYYLPSTGSLMAAPFDASRLELKGEPIEVASGVSGFSTSPFPFMGVSNSGTLVYVPGAIGQSASSDLVWVDRKGSEKALAAPPRSYVSAHISPADANKIAVAILGSDNSRDIWIYDAARGTLDRISTDGKSQGPAWTTDGKRIVYERSPVSGHPALMWAPADRSASPAVLAASDLPMAPSSVTSDGKLLLGWYPPDGKKFWTLSLAGSAGSAMPHPLLESEFRKDNPAVSPDGRWIAYTGDETGRDEVYVTSFPDPGPKITISTDGGNLPRWSGNGRELFYRVANKVMAVDIQTSPTLSAGRPKMLFETAYRSSFDVSADGQRFLMIKTAAAAQGAASEQVTIVFNWVEDLQRRSGR
jgi:eukaryotic-like serine/threonine-protein kinase